jgi:hypothetical protein
VKVTSRYAGSSTRGERERVRLVGPIDPATKRGRSGVRVVARSAARRARRAAARLSSRERASGSSNAYSAWTTAVAPKVFVEMMSAPASR